tara:strand:+ start:280 stop:879 length:600 start_codon:yes stop_codon:yes gene_type:complete
MKNLTSFLLVLALGLAFISNANASDRYLFIGLDSKTNNERLVVDLSSLDGSIVSCKIIDQNGVYVYTDNFKVQRAGLKWYNLENLKSGSYTFILNDENQTIEYKVKKERSKISIQESPNITFKPIVTSVTKNISDFHLLSLGKDVFIELYNDQGEELYSKEYIGENTISQRFNLSLSPQGEYTLKVRVGDMIYYEYFNV